MKIKSDLVTNSSSTSYLVHIPDSFDINNFLALIETDDENLSKEELIEKVKEEITYLKQSGSVHEYDNNAFYPIVNILSKLELGFIK